MKIGCLLLLPLLACGMMFGQGRYTDSLSGTVLDQTGAVIADATVELHGLDGSLVAKTVTGASGSFHLDVPSRGSYRLDISQPGFAPAEVPVKLVSIAPVAVKVVLRVASHNEDVTVQSADSSNRLSSDIADNQSANTVNRADLDHLPVFDMDYIGTLSRFLSDDATGTNGVTLVVNGLEANGPGVSPSAVKNVKINQNPYSALFSRPGRARIEITTEEGTRDFHGAANFLFRDSLFDASNAFASIKPAERRTFFEGSLTGPLGRPHGNTFLLSGENDNDDQQSIIDAQDLNGPIHQSVATPMHHLLVAARAFHTYKNGNQLWASYSYEYQTASNQGAGGTVLAEAATNFTSFEHEVNVGYTRVFSPRVLNQLRFLVGYNDEPVRSTNSAPSIIVQGAFTGGGAQANTRRTEGHFDGTDLVTYSRGRQEMKFGIDVPDISRRGFDDYRNFGGAYSFASLADYVAANPYSYTVQQGQGHVTFLEKVLSGFFEDTVRVRPNLSVAAGVRYYWQNYFHDVPHNFAPRLSLAYAPGRKSGTVLRAGAGIFYDRSGPRPISDLLHFDGRHLVKLIAENPAFPVTPEQLAKLPPGIAQLDPRLRIPYQFVFSGGIERQLTPKSTLAANYIATRGIDLFRSIDANAPSAPGYSARPDPLFGQIRQMQSEGHLKSNSLEVNFRGKPTKYFSGQAQYTLSKTYNNNGGMNGGNNGGGINYFPADSHLPDADWARSDNDRRHKFDLLGTFKANKAFDLGLALALYSGKPVNVITGNDDNHDGLAFDRPIGTPRNSLHGPGNASVDLNLTHEFSFHKGKEEGRSLTLSLNSFNVLNHPNYVTYVGVVSSPFFNHAVQAQPGRRMQLNLEYKF
jgi:Carboxypeptidase regulatory-like domain